jgi:hypothetical protein
MDQADRMSRLRTKIYREENKWNHGQGILHKTLPCPAWRIPLHVMVLYDYRF